MPKFSGIVLAAGSGKRMGTEVPKQYLPLEGKPLLVYALETFQKSAVDEIILVVAPGEVSFCQKEIVEKYHIDKVCAIVEGGAERYDSVYEGLKACSGDYVLVHDGARAFVTIDIIERAMGAVQECNACVVGMPSKDTIKIVDENGFVAATPARASVWTIQTPQCFSRSLLMDSYAKLFESSFEGITDDAMVVERANNTPICLIEGSYTNIKITTPEDLDLGRQILSKKI